MADPFLAEIKMFGGNFAPRGWAFCDGQLIAIASNSALFSLLGTTYGGDGRTTFALPDMRGNAAADQHVLLSTNKAVNETPSPGDVPAAAEFGAGLGATPVKAFGPPTAGSVVNGQTLSGNAGLNILNNGGSQAHNNMQPYLTVNYIIALQGLFPSRN